jgi:hypothetical protein
MLHVYLDGIYFKSVRDIYEVELALSTAIANIQFGHNRRVYVTLTDDCIAEDFIKAA